MTLKSLFLWGLRQRQTKALIRLYSGTSSRLEKFNLVWRDAYEHVPFYAEWKRRYNLPDGIERLDELVNWPILEKHDLMDNRSKLVRSDITRFRENVTGGSTGEPLHFRTLASENGIVAANKWIGWSRMGIYPDSRCFVLWGHRAGHGDGFLGQKIRRLKDWMTNNMRADATNLRREVLENVVDKMLRFRPVCIIAYSASLLALVRSCKRYRDQCAKLGVTAIICTAGPLSKEERDEIGSFFHAPVGMEYGSMEAGIMAYMTPMTNGKYMVFHRTHVLHVSSAHESVPGAKEVLVTKLYPAYMPLIRYRLNDCISDAQVRDDGTVIEFAEVYGRSGDEVDMGNGVKFHGQSFMLCVEGVEKIVAYQLRIKKTRGEVVLAVQTLSPLTDMEKSNIINRTSEMSGLPRRSISVVEVAELIKTPAGKIKLVVEE